MAITSTANEPETRMECKSTGAPHDTASGYYRNGDILHGCGESSVCDGRDTAINMLSKLLINQATATTIVTRARHDVLQLSGRAVNDPSPEFCSIPFRLGPSDVRAGR